MAVVGGFRRGDPVRNQQEEMRRRFGKAVPGHGEPCAPFFGAVERERKRQSSFPDQEWCNSPNGGEPPWFGVTVPDPVTGRLTVKVYWAAPNMDLGRHVIFADRGWRERVLAARSWSDVKAALAAAHRVPVSAVEVRRSLPAPVRQ